MLLWKSKQTAGVSFIMYSERYVGLRQTFLAVGMSLLKSSSRVFTACWRTPLGRWIEARQRASVASPVGGPAPNQVGSRWC
jgi:hypothetical protein